MSVISVKFYLNFLNLFANIILFLFVKINLEVNVIYLTLFYLSSFLLIHIAFNNKTIFFEKLLSLFIWLGFPFKLAIPYVALTFGFDLKLFPEVSSNIFFSSNTYNDAIIFSLYGILGFIFAIIIRKKYIFFYPVNLEVIENNLKFFYEKFRIKILITFILLFFLINFLNLYFEIYQKGVSSYFSQKYLILVFKWLLLMGLSSFACFFVYYDLIQKQKYKLSSVIFLLESFFANATILSRAFIFNACLLLLIFFNEFKNIFRLSLTTIISLFLLIVVLFFFNINLTSKLRNCVSGYKDIYKIEKIFFSKKCLNNDKKKNEEKNVTPTIKKISSLVIARWVGIDSMMAIMNKKQDLNINYYLFFIKEKKQQNNISYYEKFFFDKEKSKKNVLNTNHVILPGFISYQSITGSKIFVLISCFLMGIIGALVEKFSYRYSYNNFVLSALISYLLVFRIIHFGYLPLNSLIYFLVIIFTFLQFRIYEFILNKINFKN